MVLRRALSALLLASLAACVTAPEAPVTAERLAGCWSGESEQPAPRGKAAFQIERRGDGSFTVVFRPATARTSQVEQGRWRWQDGLYTTVTTHVDGRPVDPNDPAYTDSYQLLSLTEQDMSYVHTRLKQRFEAHRVACDSATR